MKSIAALLLLLAILSCKQTSRSQQINPYHYTPVKRIVVKHGAIATANPLASEIGAMILKKGGNAVDAAIAAQLALAVVYPAAGNIGGGGFMVIHLKNGKNTAIDFREEAPGKATRDMYLDKKGNADPQLSRNGDLSVGVPGTVAGIFLAHKEYGKLPMKELIQPAIDLAERGYAITATEARWLNENQQDFKKYNTIMPVFVKESDWHAGDTLLQKDLAHTLELIRDSGQAGFYEGETAQKIVSEMQRGNGMITLQDLKNYQAKERTPAVFDYKGYTIETMPLPSSGGVVLQQMLGMLSNYPVDQYGFESVKSVQLMTEIERRAYADRAQYLGDPDFVKVPVKELVSESYLKQRMTNYNPDYATPSDSISAGVIPPESEETTHLSVVDDSGNAVAVTYTLNNLYGSQVVVGHAGFFLNDEMDDFSAKPGAPNMFGLLGTEANAIAPGKRMLSSMTPTIVLKNDKPYLVIGSPGGATIITSVFQTIVNILDFNINVSDAVNKPKFHEQWKPDVVYVEKGFPDSVKQAMERMGYSFKERGSIGRTEVIKMTPDSIVAVADDRGDDSAAGY
ncbi:MAG: gamma-glutamyltransferase [Chitinophagaceae bacterium]|nr:MAG: gamma-glutamyltransferase [Chitinophagaceae bacterium]